MTLQPGSGKKGSKKAAASAAVKGQPSLTNFFGKSPSAATPQRDTPSQPHDDGGGGNASANPSPASSSDPPQGSLDMMETDSVSANVKDMKEDEEPELPPAQEGDDVMASSTGEEETTTTTVAAAAHPSTASAEAATTTSRPSGRGKPVSKKRGRGKGKGDKENVSNNVQDSGSSSSSSSPAKEGDAAQRGQSTAEGSQGGEEKEGAQGAGGDQENQSMECEGEAAAEANAPVAMEVDEQGGDGDEDVVEVVPAPPQQDMDTTTTPAADATASGDAEVEEAEPAEEKSKGKGKGKAKGRARKPTVPAGPPSALELKYQAQLDELLKRWRETEEAEEGDHRMGVQELVDEMTSSPAPAATTEADSTTMKEGEGGGADVAASAPDKLSELLGRLVQGSRLPLAALSQSVLQFLSEALLPCVESLTEEIIHDKIRHVAERKYYGVTPKEPPRWEDTSDLSMLVWETLDHFLPSDHASVVKELRADRSLLGRHIKAIHNLIQVIRKDPSDTAKITPLEEKVFKLDRDEEAARQKKLKRTKLKEEKEAAAAEKAEKARLKEEEKQRKELEKQKRKEEAQRKKEETEKRKRDEAAEPGAEGAQKKARASTDGASTKKKPPPPPPGQSLFKFFKKQEPKENEAGADGGKAAEAGGSGVAMEVEEKTREDGIDQAVQSGLGFHELMLRRREERKKDEDVVVITKRPHKFIKVKVAVSRAREGSMWDAPDYAELVEVELWNRMKLLQFHEDYRPAYYGTWTKRSKLVTGRTPFHKDKRLDYEYDSEEDWEEEDADQGESLSVTADDDDQDPDDGLDYEDGWLRRDDDFGLSDGEEGPDGALGANDTDRDGGLNRVGPFFFNADFECSTPLPPQREEADRVKATLEAYRVQVLDAAMLQMEGLGEEEAQTTTKAAGGAEAAATETPSSTPKPRGKPVDPEMRPALVKIVHLSTMGKDKLVEEFLKQKPGAASKAKIKTTIEEIATKQRRIKGGAVWMVKDTILAEYGMTPPVPEPEPEPTEAEQPMTAEKSSKKGRGAKKDNDKDGKKEDEKEAVEETPLKGMQKLNAFFPKAPASSSEAGASKGGIEDVVMMVVDTFPDNALPATKGDATASTDPTTSATDLMTPPPLTNTVQRRYRGSDDKGWEEAKVSSS